MANILSLMDVHATLSRLVFAVQEVLKPVDTQVSASWNNGTYLRVNVECAARDKQRVVDQLTHGAIIGEYDYRFRVSYPTNAADPWEWVTVHAYPDLSHDDKAFKQEKAR